MTAFTKLLILAACGAIASLVAGVSVGHTLSVAAAVASLSAFGMVIDDRGEFADATALSTAGTGLALVGDVVNLSVAKGIGANIANPLYLVISVDTTITSAGAATVAFVLASDAQAAIAVDGSATEHFRTRAIPKATLVAGYQLVFAVPPPQPDYEQYLGILQDVGTAALTAGKINAFLTATPPVWSARADAL
jgi:hypothetical protein